MSVQLVAPHNVAINAMNKISVRSCNALSARGSGKSEKHSANRCIGCSLLIRSYFQNPFLQIWQPLAESDMRFPCPPGEGKSPHALFGVFGVRLFAGDNVLAGKPAVQVDV